MRVFWLLLLGVLAFGVVGCSSIGGGQPVGQAQVVVKGVDKSAIMMKAEEVFFRHGFAYKGGAGQRMEFEREGGTLDNLLYGNWQGKDTFTRVMLYITPKEDGAYAMRLRSMVVRDTFGGPDNTENFDVQGGRYRVILDKIASELRAEN